MLIRVQNWWNGNCFAGSPSFILAQKLNAFKAVLIKWNREEFGDLAFRKKNLLTELMGLDAREELLFTMRFEMLIILCSLQRVFGK